MDTVFENHGSFRTASEINTAMARVYGHMSIAVLVSMLVSYFVGTTPELLQFFFTGIMKWVVMFAPIVFVMLAPIMFESTNSKILMVLVLDAFAALMGLSFAVIFAVYSMGSIFTAFMASAVLFAVMSFYGYFTKQNLESMGQFLFVGLIAIVIASIINIFIGSTVMQMVISAIAIVVFLGLTMYDTQKIREDLMDNTDDRIEIYSALTLYLDFINIFLNLLQLTGDRE
jgi:FtsH-binding integral membrane protein